MFVLIIDTVKAYEAQINSITSYQKNVIAPTRAEGLLDKLKQDAQMAPELLKKNGKVSSLAHQLQVKKHVLSTTTDETVKAEMQKDIDALEAKHAAASKKVLKPFLKRSEQYGNMIRQTLEPMLDPHMSEQVERRYTAQSSLLNQKMDTLTDTSKKVSQAAGDTKPTTENVGVLSGLYNAALGPLH